MKKYLSMLAFAAGAFMIASCSGSEADEEINNDPKVITFKISSPSTTPSSRACIDGLNIGRTNDVIWQANDAISVFGNSDLTNHKLICKLGSTNNEGQFVGDAFDSDTYYFMYPYQADATFDGTTLTAKIPTIQKATKGSFDPQAAICGGKANKGANSVSLAHACTFFVLETDERYQCEYIKLEPVSSTDWFCTGGVKLKESSSGTAITISAETGGESYVKLTADGTDNCSTTFDPGKYLMAVASSTQFPQLKVTVKYQGVAQKLVSTTQSTSLTLTAGNLYNLGKATVPTTTP